MDSARTAQLRPPRGNRASVVLHSIVLRSVYAEVTHMQIKQIEKKLMNVYSRVVHIEFSSRTENESHTAILEFFIIPAAQYDNKSYIQIHLEQRVKASDKDKDDFDNKRN